jgi:hypothetical protein
MTNCTILTFDRENLTKALSFRDDAGNKLFRNYSIEDSRHFEYLFSYLSSDNGDNLNCKTILIEGNYFSESYFYDYINYYVSCYTPILKTCQRIHFFSSQFSETNFIEAVQNHGNPLWDSYLGYIVIKPIPKGVIGATILKHYEQYKPQADSKERLFFAVKNYYVNLFGKSLVIDTMIYQEQDSIIGACATAALWFALHQLNQVFNIPLLTPAQITIAAGHRSESMEPMIPSKGLTAAQILKAIYSVNLTADVFEFDDFGNMADDGAIEENGMRGKYERDVNFIKLHVNAYSHLRVPLLLGIELDIGEDKDNSHLVTVAGLRFDETKRNETIVFAAEKIDRLFAHDDQVGPFAKIKFLPYDAYNRNVNVVTSWKETVDGGEEDSNKTKGKVSVLITPLSSDIKVHFKDIFQEFLGIAALMDEWAEKQPDAPENKVFYDLFIIESNRYKTLMVAENRLQLSGDLEILFTSLPKYVWVIQAFDKHTGSLVFDILQDPYDANFKFAPIMTHIYSAPFSHALGRGGNDEPWLRKLQDIFKGASSELRIFVGNMLKAAKNDGIGQGADIA